MRLSCSRLQARISSMSPMTPASVAVAAAATPGSMGTAGGVGAGGYTNREHAAVDVERVNRGLGSSPRVHGVAIARLGAIPIPKGELGECHVPVENRMADWFSAGFVDEHACPDRLRPRFVVPADLVKGGGEQPVE